MGYAEDNLSSLIYNANVVLKYRVRETLKPFGITPEQWIILRYLDSKSGEVNQKMVAEECRKEQASITRILDLLQKRDLIERKKSETDRREYIVHITEDGKELFQETLPVMEQEEKEINELISAKEYNQVAKALTKLLRKVDEGALD